MLLLLSPLSALLCNKFRIANMMKPFPIIELSVILVQLASVIYGKSHYRSQSPLVRRAVETTSQPVSNVDDFRNENEAEILLDDAQHFTVITPVNSASQITLSQGTVLIQKAEITHGPSRFSCFFYAPLHYSSDYFISPVLHVASENNAERSNKAQAQQQKWSAERSIPDASSMTDDDFTAEYPTDRTASISAQQLQIPHQNEPFPAKTMFCYRLPDPTEDVLILLEDGNGEAHLYLVKLEQQLRRKNRIGILLSPGIGNSSSRSKDISDDFKTTLPPTLRRAALIAAPKLERTSCLLDINIDGNKGTFDAISPLSLAKPVTQVIGLLCKEE